MNKAMFARIRASKEKEGGFTLIELLIVVVILGILAAVVIFASGGFKDKGAAESCKINVSTVATAAEAFHADSPTGAYPATFGDLQTPVKYFEANGVGVSGTIMSGKGWQTNVVFTTGAAPAFTTPAAGTAFAPAAPPCNKA